MFKFFFFSFSHSKYDISYLECLFIFLPNSKHSWNEIISKVQWHFVLSDMNLHYMHMFLNGNETMSCCDFSKTKIQWIFGNVEKFTIDSLCIDGNVWSEMCQISRSNQNQINMNEQILDCFFFALSLWHKQRYHQNWLANIIQTCRSTSLFLQHLMEV